MVPTESMTVERVSFEVNWLLVKVGTGDIDNEIVCIAFGFLNDILFLEQADIHNLGVMRPVPEDFLILVNLVFRQPVQEELLVLFCDTQHNDSTGCICKGRVGVPKSTRKTTFGTFKLNHVSFFLAAIEARWRKIADTLLLPDVTLNDLRHSFAVKQLESGKSDDEVNRQLGIDNSRWFRAFYRDLVSADERERLEKAHLDARKERIAPEHINRPSIDEESSELRRKIAERREELRLELESLEGDLGINRSLRNSDCVQGANRQGLYNFIEKVLGDDKDGQFLVEYLRCNMRVADMPLLKVTTPQAIRCRVTHGFEKLSLRLSEIYAVEGYDMLGMFNSLCDAVIAAAPPVSRRPGPRPKETVESRYKAAMDALSRLSSIEQAPFE